LPPPAAASDASSLIVSRFLFRTFPSRINNKCAKNTLRYTRECHAIHAAREIKSDDVLRVLKEAIDRHGAPAYIRSDNAPEFIAYKIQSWLDKRQIDTLYIDPGCPWHNGYVESFNSRFRAECLNRELIYTLSEARFIFKEWMNFYNNIRPHRSLSLLTPTEFAQSPT
jgi:transposase InsO family protein